MAATDLARVLGVSFYPMSRYKMLLGLAVLLGCSVVGPAQTPAGSSSSKPASASPQQTPTLAEAQAKLDRGDVDEALAELKQLQANSPNTSGLSRALGVASFRKADFATAATELQKVTTQNPEDKEAVQLLGLSYYYMGRTKDAIPLLERVHSWFPVANVDASYLLGISYVRVSDYEKARTAFAEMYGVGPESAASHLILARMLLREGYDPIAEQELLKAVELDPKLPGVHLFLGELYTFKSQMDKAIPELETELRVDPVNAEALYKLADAYTHVQKWDDAQRMLQRSIWLDSTSTGPFVLMAKVLLKKNEALLSSRAAQKAISMDANNYYAHFLLGQAYLKLGKKSEADAEMKLSQELQSRQTHSAEELRVKKGQ
ncbi:MAG: tetratricopeptide repeat protein [Terriglobales bacterium]